MKMLDIVDILDVLTVNLFHFVGVLLVDFGLIDELLRLSDKRTFGGTSTLAIWMCQHDVEALRRMETRFNLEFCSENETD